MAAKKWSFVDLTQKLLQKDSPKRAMPLRLLSIGAMETRITTYLWADFPLTKPDSFCAKTEHAAFRFLTFLKQANYG
jgi:hypothetical protein